jgi:hypothetical protein
VKSEAQMNSCSIYIRNKEKEKIDSYNQTREKERKEETNNLSNNKLRRRVSKLNMHFIERGNGC